MSAGPVSKFEKEKLKLIQEKCQTLLNDMLRDEDNKYCVDCDAKGPRWASWNLGLFLCIRCAGIHRNLGVHISRVKSVNLDTWTPEQVVNMQSTGNSRARAIYEANLPESFRRPQTDSALESFIRAKYEHKKYVAREWVQPPLVTKVDWESEIEESLVRKKKKATAPAETVSLPKVPTPKVAPKAAPALTVPEIPLKSIASTISSASEDLLGLDNNNTGGGEGGLFGPSVPASSAPIKSQSNDLDDIFMNTGTTVMTPGEPEPAMTIGGQNKLTKESILSLYGKAPPQQMNPFAGGGVNLLNTNPFPEPGGLGMAQVRNQFYGLSMNPPPTNHQQYNFGTGPPNPNPLQQQQSLLGLFGNLQK